MENYQTSAVGLTLKDLIVYLLRGWKLILLLAVIFGILLGAYGGVSLRSVTPFVDTDALDAEKAAIQAEIDALNGQVDENTALLEEQEAALEQMEEDLKNHSKTLKEKQVVLQDMKDQLAAIRENYDAMDTLLASARSLYDNTSDGETKAALFSQMYSCSNRKLELSNALSVKEAEIRAYSKEIEEFRDTTDAKEDISDQKDSISDTKKSISDLKGLIKKSDDSVKKLESRYVPAPIAPTLRERAVNAVKKGIIGAVLGFVLACGVLFLKFYFSPVILNERDLASFVGTDFYASLEVSDQGGIKGKVNRLAGISSSADRDRTLMLLAESLPHKADEIVLTGTAAPQKLQALSEQLAALTKGQCRITCTPCPIDDPSTFAFCRGRSVLLVEAVNTSRKKRIASVVALLRNNQIPIIGCLTIN